MIRSTLRRAMLGLVCLLALPFAAAQADSSLNPIVQLSQSVQLSTQTPTYANQEIVCAGVAAPGNCQPFVFSPGLGGNIGVTIAQLTLKIATTTMPTTSFAVYVYQGVPSTLPNNSATWAGPKFVDPTSYTYVCTPPSSPFPQTYTDFVEIPCAFAGQNTGSNNLPILTDASGNLYAVVEALGAWGPIPANLKVAIVLNGWKQ